MLKNANHAAIFPPGKYSIIELRKSFKILIRYVFEHHKNIQMAASYFK